MGRQYDIPTIMTSCLAVAMSIMYFVMPEATKQIFIVFATISWFLVAICWLALKSTQYMHRYEGHEHEEKKKLTNYNNGQQNLQMTSSQLSQVKSELNAELDSLRSSLKNKDEEIGNLKSEISSLQTLVEIEKLKVDLANLKALAAKESAKRKK
jgi:peptidoglycan hydrolase CwlO-like protein